VLRVMLDENNDLPPGGPRLVNGLESAGVALQAVFGTQAGEWPFDLLFGMRWRQEVFGKYFDANATNQAAAATANTVPDIQPVTGNQITLDTTTQADARQVDITIEDIQLRTTTGAPASLTISVAL
jgi:hypothetical protein